MTAFEYWILDNTALWVSILVVSAINSVLLTVINIRRVWRNEK